MYSDAEVGLSANRRGIVLYLKKYDGVVDK